MEIWDAYNEDGTLAGCDLVRGEAIPKGLFHVVSEVIVKHKDGMYLLMQRDYKKSTCPGLFEAGAGGAVQKGETPYEGAVRELKEETGIEAEELIPLYKHKWTDVIFYGYLCETDCDKNSITLQEGETISYLWMDKEEFLKFVDSDKFITGNKDRMSEYLNSIKEICN